MLRPPGKSVIFLPFLFKHFAVASPCPKFRFFEVNGMHAGIDHSFDNALLHEFNERSNRYYIRNISSMPYGIAFGGYLSFTQVVLSIPFAQEIIVILPPGD